MDRTPRSHQQDPDSAGSAPEAAYAERLSALTAEQTREQRGERRLGLAKLALAAVTLAAGVLLIHRGAALSFLLVPIAAFAACALLQDRLLRSLRVRARTIDYYQRGQRRLQGTWAAAPGETGERFLREDHPYARDLDIFGAGSLFACLNTARTRAGEEMLAAWLLTPAPTDAIAARQAAVAELRGRMAFREQLYSAGDAVPRALDPAALAAWGESRDVLLPARLRRAAVALAALWLCGLAAWAVTGSPVPALLMTVLNFAFAHRIHARVEAAAATVEKAADDLKLLAGLLALAERESFTAPRLRALQAALRPGTTSASLPASGAIARLAGLADLLAARHSLFAKPLDLVTFWSVHVVARAGRWRGAHGPAVRAWIDSIGELEALAALSTFAYEHPASVFPHVAPGAPLFEADDLTHPLLPPGKATGNDVRLHAGAPVMILSGPNMAGKSTFMRAVGVNAVLAQAGAPVCARRLACTPLQVAASICILDSLSGGVSRFYAEIHRVKRIAELASGPIPVLFLLDELLSGTNSHDRVDGTEYVLASLLDRHALGVVSTHDLALTALAGKLGHGIFNCHFEDRVEGDALLFDYKLKPGVVRTSNALKLMRAIGLDVPAQDA